MLSTLLASRNVSCEYSSDVGAGVDLAEVSLDRFDFAVAVLPRRSAAAGGAGSAAILVEIGVCAARRIPLFAVASPDEPPIAALGTLMTVRTSLDNVDALRLHLDVFIGGLHRQGARSTHWTDKRSGSSIENQTDISSQQDAVRVARELLDTESSEQENSAVVEDRILHLLGQLLTVEGAYAQQKLAGTRGDQGIDLAFAHPSIPDTVLVEVKQNASSPEILRKAQSRLSEYVTKHSGAIGLLLVSDSASARQLEEMEGHPLVRTLTLGEFFDIAESRHLDDFLRSTRNQMVHRS